MSRTLTKTDVEFEGVNIVIVPDPRGGDTLLVSVGYTVLTSEGETIKRDLVGDELTGAQKVLATDLIAGIKADLIAREDI